MNLIDTLPPSVVHREVSLSLIVSKLRRDEFWLQRIEEVRRYSGPNQEAGQALLKAAAQAKQLINSRMAGTWTDAMMDEWFLRPCSRGKSWQR